MSSPSPGSRSTIRGAIRVSVSTSRDALIAGDHFSVFVKVQNPFEVPLRLMSISAFVPVEFYDLEERRQERLKRASQAGGAVGQGLERLWGLLGARAAAELEEHGARLGMVTARPIDARASAPGEAPSVGGLLQPGNSSTEVFTLTTRRERRFRPGSYRLQVSVRYRFEVSPDEEPTGSGAVAENSDVFEVVLDVRSSLSSILIGGVVGCVAGWVARTLPLWEKMPREVGLGQLAVHVLLTLGVLLLFARKKDVQPLLSVEDAYGGALIGFMLGFSGESAAVDALKMPM